MADLSALQLLVAKAQAVVAAKASVKLAEVKVKKARSEPERESAQSALADMLAIVDWRSTAIVLLLDCWTCSCGHHGASPQGMFFYQEHTRVANSTRLVPPRSESLGNDLPKRIKYDHRIVSVCDNCCNDAGFTKPLERQSTPEERRFALRRPGMYVSDWNDKRLQTEETPNGLI